MLQDGTSHSTTFMRNGDWLYNERGIAAVIVDTSALIAILRDVPEAAACARAIEAARRAPNFGSQLRQSCNRH